MRLRGVRSVFVNDLLIDLLVCTFNRAGVHYLGGPELPLAVERFVEVPRIAARVTERQPEPVGCVLGKEA